MDQPIETRVKHRDLNWLSFNKRVLQEAADKRNPLYERLRFLAIFSSNLDEYYRVRVSQLRQIKKIKKSLRKKLALKPSRKVKEIIARVKEHQKEFGHILYDQILPELAENNIYLLEQEDLKKRQLEQAEEFFKAKIKSHLAPQIIDFTEEKKAFLENNTIYFFVNFSNSDKAGLVNIPVEEVGRFYRFSKSGETLEITFIDEILRVQMQQVFPDFKISGIYEVKMSRDAELYIDDQYNGVLAEKIYASLKQRTDGQPTRLLYDAEMPKDLQKKIRKHLGLGKIDMMPGGKYHNLSDFFELPEPKSKPELFFKELPPLPQKNLENSSNLFKTIYEQDQLVHYPYQSFSYLEKFLEQAVNDSQVVEIKISLYRVADESKLTTLLLRALDNGKDLTVFIEAKARFDEENNIEWGKKFEEKGARVIYSYPKIKVHSKILLVHRIEEDQKVGYAYIGTGNFNSKTSEIYADHALFTAHKKISKELDRVFKVLEGELIIPRTKNLLVSPFNTRQEFTKMILNEIDLAKQGKKAQITAKMNSLEDTEIIDLLYRASQKGVKIRLLVRGFTCLIPGKKGLSENIYMTSILDRYLEHGRIYLFNNDGDEYLYIGSADWMTRNLDRRIEVLTPIYDNAVAEEIKDILNIQLADNVKARIQDEAETNDYVVDNSASRIRSQYKIYEYLKEKNT